MSEKLPFEKIFPYFSYRWRYNDGQFSPYAPFSKVAFIPKDPDVEDFFRRGHNTSVANKLEQITLKDIDRGGPDVEAVDILYTESISSTIYVLKTIEIGHRHLLKLGIKKPRIGLCGLNPHASEEGIFGQEEEKHLTPAVLNALDLGIDIVGPISPDIIFREANKGQYDLIIANYHDQGHIPVKLLYFDQSVNVTLGVPFIRTSVDHGTAYDIAYKNVAKARNMVAAIIYALKMINN